MACLVEDLLRALRYSRWLVNPMQTGKLSGQDSIRLQLFLFGFQACRNDDCLGSSLNRPLIEDAQKRLLILLQTSRSRFPLDNIASY